MKISLVICLLFCSFSLSAQLTDSIGYVTCRCMESAVIADGFDVEDFEQLRGDCFTEAVNQLYTEIEIDYSGFFEEDRISELNFLLFKSTQLYLVDNCDFSQSLSIVSFANSEYHLEGDIGLKLKDDKAVRLFTNELCACVEENKISSMDEFHDDQCIENVFETNAIGDSLNSEGSRFIVAYQLGLLERCESYKFLFSNFCKDAVEMSNYQEYEKLKETEFDLFLDTLSNEIYPTICTCITNMDLESSKEILNNEFNNCLLNPIVKSKRVQATLEIEGIEAVNLYKERIDFTDRIIQTLSNNCPRFFDLMKRLQN